MIDGFTAVVNQHVFFMLGDIFVLPYTYVGTSIACNMPAQINTPSWRNKVIVTVYTVLMMTKRYRYYIRPSIQGDAICYIYTKHSYENILYDYATKKDLSLVSASCARVWQLAYDDILSELY